MGNEVSSEITKEDLVELKKKQIQLEKENRKIREELEKSKNSKTENKEKKKDKIPIPNSSSNKKVNIDYKNKNLSLDPFELFHLEPDCSIEDIRARYKKLILKYHPDKSGYDSTQEFRILQKAYAVLLSMKEEEARLTGQLNQTIESKEAERKDFDHDMDRVNYQFEPGSGMNFNRDKFNQMFEQNRFTDENEKGYKDWMKDDSNFTQEQPKVISKEGFNNAFEEYIQKQSSGNKITRYVDPETLICTTAGYEELGNDGNDFTNHGKYTDLKKAYTQTTLHPGQIKRDEYKTIEQLKAARNGPMVLSPEEQEYLAQKKRQEEDLEMARQNKMRERDMAIEKHYSRLHGKAIELPSYKR